MLDKKAQIGETMTWVVATIIILVVLIVSLYVSSQFAKGKDFLAKTKTSLSPSEKINSDLILEKSLFVYFLSSSNSGAVYNFLQSKNSQNYFYVDLDKRKTELGDSLN